jgi:hypothetical protein
MSLDGRVTVWTLNKNELQHTDIMLLKLTPALASSEEEEEEETSVVGLAGTHL